MADRHSSDNNILRLAVQKKGRLSEGTFELLEKCGLTIYHGRDKLYARVAELPIDILLIRDDDIPEFVENGASDLGVIGKNVFEEYSSSPPQAQIVMPLGFSQCRLCIAVPQSEHYDGAWALSGKSIATSYPRITDTWLKAQGVAASLVMMNGAVEIAPRLNIAEAICDIVSTGGTLDANGLKAVETIYHSEAVLIKNTGPLSDEKHTIFDALVKRIHGVRESAGAKYIMLNAPREAVKRITEILPGQASPTILELAGGEDMVAMHVVCRESVFWETLEALKGRGASDILVLPIEKMLA